MEKVIFIMALPVIYVFSSFLIIGLGVAIILYFKKRK